MIKHRGAELFNESRSDLHREWSETSARMQRLRDNPACADSEHLLRSSPKAPGLSAKLSFDVHADPAAPFVARDARPRLAVLREQGVNGQIEMAAAFNRAGFDTVDVHMSDIISGRVSLADFRAWPPAAVSATAMYWAPARAGPRAFCSMPALAISSRPSSAAATLSRWACAMAAR